MTFTFTLVKNVVNYILQQNDDFTTTKTQQIAKQKIIRKTTKTDKKTKQKI